MPKSKKTINVRDQVPAQDPKGGRFGLPPKHTNQGGGGGTGKNTQRHGHHTAPN